MVKLGHALGGHAGVLRAPAGAQRLSSLLCQLLLLHYKASTEVQDNNGNTPLHLACTYGHEDVSAPLPHCPQTLLLIFLTCGEIQI